jgi:hypothetical protein
MIKMNKKIILFLSILTGFSFEIYSQNYYLGYKYGISWNGVNSNGNLIGTSQNNFSTGLTFDVITNKRLRLGSEILFEKRGFNLGYSVIFNNFDERLLINYHYQDYLSIPLKIGYQTGNKIYGYGDFGLVPAFNLKSTFKYPKTDNSFNIIGEITENEQLEIRPFDLSALIDFGVGYNFTEKISILCSIRIQKSLFEFSKDYQMSHRSATLFLSFRYMLRK